MTTIGGRTVAWKRTRARYWHWGRCLRAVSLASGLAGVSTACDSLLKSDQVPSGTADPALTKTAEGALAAYYGTVKLFQVSFGTVNGSVASSGLITDELRVGSNLGRQAADPTDLRRLPELLDRGPYVGLQKVRGQAGQAIGLLSTYSPERRALIGHTYTLQAYTEVFLAEQYCSGIPLSTLDFEGDFTYKPGSTTAQVLTHAVALFDTALTLVGDSAQFVQLAMVGKGRALLGLGDVAGAATAVASVSDAFRYQLAYPITVSSLSSVPIGNFAGLGGNGDANYSVADQEGTNGLDYISSGDPRTASTALFTNPAGYGVYAANKYPTDGSSPIVLASGAEARLIEAEKVLRDGDVSTWLAKLNALRTGGGPITLTVPDTVVDTLGYTGCTFQSPCDDNGYAPNADYSGLEFVGSYTIQFPDPEPPEVQQCRDIRDAAGKNYLCLGPTANVYADPAHTHTVTVVPNGTGGVAGLDALADPGAALAEPAATNARVDLMFRERAFWLFLTGHRQGDLRRLIRQYGPSSPDRYTQDQVFPAGQYPSTDNVPYQYGDDVTFPVPPAEVASNPLYTGCFRPRGA